MYGSDGPCMYGSDGPGGGSGGPRDQKGIKGFNMDFYEFTVFTFVSRFAP